jgi:hypothetical protein
VFFRRIETSGFESTGAAAGWVYSLKQFFDEAV